MESRQASPCAGLDEAGRGCLAGPVVAAAVILPPGRPLRGLADSKTLTPRVRTDLAAQIKGQAFWAVGVATAAVIDRINILNASLLAMARAVARLSLRPGALLVDGRQIIPAALLRERWPWPELPEQKAVIHGDALVEAISAASIVAKTTRDALMVRASRRWPDFGFERHKGYGTKEHLEALGALGPTPIHRRTFRGVLRGPERDEL